MRFDPSIFRLTLRPDCAIVSDMPRSDKSTTITFSVNGKIKGHKASAVTIHSNGNTGAVNGGRIELGEFWSLDDLAATLQEIIGTITAEDF